MTHHHEILGGFGSPLAAGAIALAVSWILTPFVRTLAIKKGAVDDPKRDDRRIHKEPLPRWGGLAIFAGILVSILVIFPIRTTRYPIPLIGIEIISAGLVLFGLFDDIKEFSARLQLVALLGAGLLVQLFHGRYGQSVQIHTLGIPGSEHFLQLPPVLSMIVTSIYIFVITKTMDTIDGVDGLASGIATVCATTLAIIAWYMRQPPIALAAAAVAGASLGFLRHNYNPAKIIMGTGGAYVLGFTLACLSIVGALKTAVMVSVFVPMLAFGVPIFDAFFVIIRRILSGTPITKPDKRHLHHMLLSKGLSQRQTVSVLLSLATLLCVVLFLLIQHFYTHV